MVDADGTLVSDLHLGPTIDGHVRLSREDTVDGTAGPVEILCSDAAGGPLEVMSPEAARKLAAELLAAAHAASA